MFNKNFLEYSFAMTWTLLAEKAIAPFHFHALEKETATHSSVLAWRIPGTGERGGLPSMGSHRVRHEWSNLAAELFWGSKIKVKIIIPVKLLDLIRTKQHFCIRKFEGNKTKLRDINSGKESPEERNYSFPAREIRKAHLNLLNLICQWIIPAVKLRQLVKCIWVLGDKLRHRNIVEIYVPASMDYTYPYWWCGIST